MKVWTRIEHYGSDSSRPLILAMGNFDGVHLGHRQILVRVVTHAKKKKGIAAVLTFAEHPQRVLHPSHGPALLTSPQHRLFLFQEIGIEICFLLPFTPKFSKTDPKDFVRDWLVERLHVNEVHFGYNAHFGFNRKGDALLMRKLSERFHFDFHEAPSVKIGEEFVSSSLIRQLIQGGDIQRAAKLLGRPFSILASVVRGTGRGRSLGFPTANLNPHSEILPPYGVYPAEARRNQFHLKPLMEGEAFEYEREELGEWYRGVLNHGVRPTLDPQARETAEVFLLGFSGDLYGKTLEIVFHPRLREEKKFDGSSALIEAIQQDVAQVERYFSGKALQSG